MEASSPGPSMAQASDVLGLPFDQYGRYRLIEEVIDSLRWQTPLRILDVGGSPATLSRFMPKDQVIVADMADQGGLHLFASGLGLPFADASFDVVVTSDTLEHVVSTDRPCFLSELTRVAREAVVIGAPFDDPAVVQAEEVLQGLIRARYQEGYAFLEEHRRNGLPSLEVTLQLLQGQSFYTTVLPSGYLHRWLLMLSAFFLLQWRFQDPQLNARANAYYNTNFYRADNREPSYRKVIVATRTRETGALKTRLCPEEPAVEREAMSHLPVLSAMTQVLVEGWSTRALTLQSQLLEREREVHAKNQEVRARDQEIRAKDQRIGDLKAQMDEAVQALTGRAADLERQGADLQRRLVEQEQAGRLLSRELDQIHGSKWWKLFTFYHANKRRVTNVLGHVVPRGMRRRAGDTPRPPLAPPTRVAVRIPPARKLDVICFPIIDWNFRFQRPQQLLTQFARDGHRVFYLRTRFTGTDQAAAQVTPLGDRIYELALPGDPKTLYHRDLMPGETLTQASAAMQEFIREEGIDEAVCLVQFPFWTPLAESLKQALGWKVVYDCMDDHAGFDANNPNVLNTEAALIVQSDLVVTTSWLLYARQRERHPNCILVPNAGDFAHFSALPAREASPLARLPRPVIGYYGAIAEWFDVAAVRAAAVRHPEWSFVLIGRTFGAKLDALKPLRNVQLLGEKRYGDLPSFVAGFDVCTIPFLRTPLTNATNPVKIFEYLSAGKPVVAAALPELEPLSDVTCQYTTPDQFVVELERALADGSPELVARRQEVARENTWEARYQALKPRIESLYGKTCVIIVTWNNLQLTRRCIQSILADSTWPRYEVVVVDNASSDGTAEYLQSIAEREPRIHIVLNGSNLGFAAANNVGLQHAPDAEYIVFLNNDTIVPAGWLARLLRHVRDPRVGMVGPVTNWAGNEAKINVDYADPKDMERFAKSYVAAHEGQAFDIKTLAMYCVGMRKAVVDQIGPLDERFGVGMFEDDDYARRVRQAGYRVICAEDVFVHHQGMASFSKLPQAEYTEIFQKNKRLYEEKWGEPWIPHQGRAAS